jgi:hypothetical protein
MVARVIDAKPSDLKVDRWYTWGTKTCAYKMTDVINQGALKTSHALDLLNSSSEVRSVSMTLYPDPTDFYEVHVGVDEVPSEGPITSDGGSTDYYRIPEHATELRHLISARGMSKSRGDIFKACYRLGEKAGVDVLYDLKKMKFFIEDLIEMHGRGERL